MMIDPLTADRVGQLLSRLDVPGPRYTSYPTADRFTDTFGADQYRQALQQRARDTQAGIVAPLSVYVHIPFCESICYYCACNKVITKHHESAGEYLTALRREVELHLDVLGRGAPLTQLHFGGGSPTFLSDDELAQLMTVLRDAFGIAPDAEVSIEVDPRTVDEGRLRHLAHLGFNRLSFGVQDFDPDVQKAVHREQPLRSGCGADPAGTRDRLQVDQCRPHLRAAAPDAGHFCSHRGTDGRAAARPHRAVRLRPPATAIQAATAHPCPRVAAGR
jgi:oxygen-independent coproporphyrinogen-3 oxidase